MRQPGADSLAHVWRSDTAGIVHLPLVTFSIQAHFYMIDWEKVDLYSNTSLSKAHPYS